MAKVQIFSWFRFAIKIGNQLTFVVHKTYRTGIIPSLEMASHHIVIIIIIVIIVIVTCPTHISDHAS